MNSRKDWATECPICHKEYDPFGTGDNWYSEYDCEYPDTCFFDGWEDPADPESNPNKGGENENNESQ